MSSTEHVSSTEQADAILDRLRAGGGRATSTRRVTIQVLLEAGHVHITAEEIAARVRRQFPDVAESTIYRTLAALEELDVVQHVHLGHGPSTYHLAQTPHQHLLCEACGTVIEIPDDEFADLGRRIEAGYGFEIHPHHFAMLGECRSCRQTPRPAAGDSAPL